MKITKFDIIRQDIEYHLGLLFHAFTQKKNRRTIKIRYQKRRGNRLNFLNNILDGDIRRKY